MDQTPAPPPIIDIWQPPQPKQSPSGFAKAAMFVAGAAAGFLMVTLLLVTIVSSAASSLFNSFSFHF